jgi:hypothetical protein
MNHTENTSNKNYRSQSTALSNVHDTAIYCNPHSLSDWDSHFTRRLVANTPSVKMLCPQRIASLCTTVKTQHGAIFGLLWIGQAFYVSRKNVCRWVTTNCCFMSEVLVVSQTNSSNRFFIVVPCILIILKLLSPTNANFIEHIKC